MPSRLPLNALLSFALVAFTIEFDNEAEHRLPHWTTQRPGGPGTWLISMAMWLNCLRWVPEQGIAVQELVRRARTQTNWDGMRRWGYIWFEPDPADRRPKPPASSLIVRTTTKGRLAQPILAPLIGEIEARWRRRFGGQAIGGLHRALLEISADLNPNLPDCMPILGYGLVTARAKPGKTALAESSTPRPPAELALPMLLARVLVGFALEFELESDVSLAICADVLRVVQDEGTRVRDLPRLGGISKEAVAMALGFLTKRGFTKVASDRRAGSAKTVLLTPSGIEARENYPHLAARVEEAWVKRYRREKVVALRAALESITGDGAAERSPLFRGLEPYPDGWRSKPQKPDTLPHYPMVLHRGGYPDGA